MWRRRVILLLLFCLAVGGLLDLPQPEHTKVDLVDLSTGRTLLSLVLRDGEQVTLTWTNSLFSLPVVEVFIAEEGTLVLQEVTFGDVHSTLPPQVTSADVENLYHTGGAFTSRDMHRPFHRVVFRVGEIGDPAFRARDQVVRFKERVGFGGRIVLITRQARFYDPILSLKRRLLVSQE